MGKYSEVSSEIENLIIEISNEMGLAHMGVDFQALNVSKSKEICKVVRANELAEFVRREVEGAIIHFEYIPVSIVAHTGPGTIGLGIVEKI